jgi:CDP-diacylglycerol--glycerol-3-phosphate 3-phosphatidyltransferase
MIWMWTIPNLLTIFRVLLVPVFVFFLLGERSDMRLIALIIFFLAAFTDYLDGRIARSLNQRSEFGNFADPLADKLLVAAALISFVFIPATCIPLWAVLLILVREVLITCLRIFAVRRNEAIETSFLGKSKTVAQMVTIVTVLILLIIQAYIAESHDTCIYVYNGYLPDHATWTLADATVFWGSLVDDAFLGRMLGTLPLILILITCFLTVYSGIVYLWLNRKIFFTKSKE